MEIKKRSFLYLLYALIKLYYTHTHTHTHTHKRADKVKNETMRAGPNPAKLASSWEEEIWTYKERQQAWIHRGKTVWGYGDMVAICQLSGIRRNQTCQHLALGLLASSTIRK